MVEPVTELVLLNTLFIGLKGLLIVVPLTVKVSVGSCESPSQAIKPAFAFVLLSTNKFVRFICKASGTPCKPS